MAPVYPSIDRGAIYGVLGAGLGGRHHRVVLEAAWLLSMLKEVKMKLDVCLIYMNTRDKYQELLPCGITRTDWSSVLPDVPVVVLTYLVLL